MEGKHCYPPSSSCTQTGILPVSEYGHLGPKCSVTGGYVSRGTALPGLEGVYFFADYCDGTVFGIAWPDYLTPAEWTMIEPPTGQVSSFGQDAAGELYIVQLSGDIWKIVPSP